MPQILKSLLLIRHGQTFATDNYRFSGSTNHPLTIQGCLSAENLRPSFADFRADASFVSPLQRCQQTAQHLIPFDHVTMTHHGLAELDFGSWENHTYQEIYQSNPESFTQMRSLDPAYSPPNGESLHAFFTRVLSALSDILDTPYQRVAIITHGGVIRTILCHLLKLKRTQSFHHFIIHPLSIIELYQTHNSWSIRRIIHP